MQRFFLLFLLCGYSLVHAYTMDYIASTIKSISERKAFDVKVLYTLAQVESNFNPFMLSMVLHKKDAKQFELAQSKRVKVVTSQYRNEKEYWLVNFFPDNLAFAKSLARTFKQQKIIFNAGLTQINSQNFNTVEVDSIFEPHYNLAKAIDALNECRKIYEESYEIIECYKSGTRFDKTFPYFTKFMKQYYQNFGEE